MGDDAPIAPLAGRGRPLASYFRQRFAQVTNPAIDHYRERTVMSVATLVGARAPLDAEGPLPPLVVLPSFLVTPDGLAALAPERGRRDLHRGRGTRVCGRARRRSCVALARVRRHGRLPHRRATRAATARRSRRLLAVAAAHGRLVERGLRTSCSLLVSSDERARHAHGRDARRLRRGRRLPAARARDGRAARRDRQGRRRPADARGGAGPAAPLRSRTVCSR